MTNALDLLRNVHAEVKGDKDALRPCDEHGSPDQTRAIMLELAYQGILNDLHNAIRKMEILNKHFY